MSGGHYQYLSCNIRELADAIQRELNENFMEEAYEWSSDGKAYDRLSDVPEGERIFVFEAIQKLQKRLKRVAKQAHALEWFLSGDTGYMDFMKAMAKKQV